jgi:hypothetical protein
MLRDLNASDKFAVKPIWRSLAGAFPVKYGVRLRPRARGSPKESIRVVSGIRHLRIGEERPNSITDYAAVSIAFMLSSGSMRNAINPRAVKNIVSVA